LVAEELTRHRSVVLVAGLVQPKLQKAEAFLTIVVHCEVCEFTDRWWRIVERQSSCQRPGHASVNHTLNNPGSLSVQI
jgi:hypothetical protein